MPARRLSDPAAALALLGLLIGASGLAGCAGSQPPADARLEDRGDGPGTLTPDAPTGDLGDGGDLSGDGAACQPVLGFKTCAEPVEVGAGGGQFCGDTSMTDNLYSAVVDPASGCDGPTPEPEYVFRVAVTGPSRVEARARPLADFRVTLYLRTGCIDERAQRACSQSVAGGDPAVLTLDRLEAGVYYLFVDGAADPDGPGQNRGPFQLSLEIIPLPP